MSDLISQLSRIIGTSDLPWFVRMSFGLLIGLVILYLILIFTTPKDLAGGKDLKAWVLDALKIVFGAVIGILSQAAGLAQSTTLPPH